MTAQPAPVDPAAAEENTFKLSVNVPAWLIKAIRTEKAQTDTHIHEIVYDQLIARYPEEHAKALRMRARRGR